MFPGKYSDLICDTARIRDYANGTTIRAGKTVGFSETEGRERAVSADQFGNGALHLTACGEPSHNEDGTLETCEMLIRRLNEIHDCYWGAPEKNDDPQLHYIDAISRGIGAYAGRELKIQVIRAVIVNDYWQALHKNGRSELTRTVDEMSDHLKKVIEKKVNRIPADVRQELVLALGAIDVPAAAFDDVINSFNRNHTRWVRTLGFQSVWVVGPTLRMVHQLGA